MLQHFYLGAYDYSRKWNHRNQLSFVYVKFHWVLNPIYVNITNHPTTQENRYAETNNPPNSN